MSAIEIHVTANTQSNPVKINGTFAVQVVGDLGGGTLTPQGRLRELRADGSEESFSPFVDPATLTNFTFTAAGGFELTWNGEFRASMASGSSPDFYVLLTEIKTVKI